MKQFEPGTVLAEKYRLESRLGEGGMGTVYRATHLLLQAPVAIKVIDREVSEGDVTLSRFMREAQAAASLRSPHVVQVLDYGTEQGRPFMVMELLEGESLADRLDRLSSLTPAETYRVISHVARAVARAHETGIIHRDLKPDNVFLVHNEEDEIAKVLDFGVAKVEATALAEESQTRTGSLLGTPYYMSPEQAQGNKAVDYRSDLWALGVIAFECITGHRPFYSDGLGEVVLKICIRDIPRPSSQATVPEGFDEWFARATERDPTARFQSARELSEALRFALGLGQDVSGPVPEASWSTAAALSQSDSLPHVRPASAEATTESHQDSEVASLESGQPAFSARETPVSERQRASATELPPVEENSDLRSPLPDFGEREIHRTEGQGGAKWEESVEPPPAADAAPDSQWEIVPHDQPSHQDNPQAPTALEFALAEEKKGSGSVLLVGLSAILLGAAAVLFVRGFSGDESDVRSLRPGDSVTASQQADKPAPSSSSSSDNQEGSAPRQGKPSDREDSDPSAENPPPPAHATDTPEEDGSPHASQEKGQLAREDEVLDAIDAAAAEKAAQEGDEADQERPEDEADGAAPQDSDRKKKTNKENQGEPPSDATEPNSPAPDTGSEEDTSNPPENDGATPQEEGEQAPQPKVPEGLSPPPPPPPPTP